MCRLSVNFNFFFSYAKVVDADKSCQILNGVALTGHLIHSHLPTQLYRPRILILASSVTYERNIYKRTWLESYAAQVSSDCDLYASPLGGGVFGELCHQNPLLSTNCPHHRGWNRKYCAKHACQVGNCDFLQCEKGK